MNSELFIYWRVADAAAAEAALSAVREMQAALCLQHAGLIARLYQRSDEAASGTVTVMETYARRGAFDAPLQAVIVEQGHQVLAPWCTPVQRHVEVFSPVE